MTHVEVSAGYGITKQTPPRTSSKKVRGMRSGKILPSFEIMLELFETMCKRAKPRGFAHSQCIHEVRV